MKYININDSFSDIGTVVFYKHHKFIPPDFWMITDPNPTEVFRSDLVKYHGSDRNFPGIDFAEYDFSYIPNKYKFSNKLFLTELDSESAEIVGKNINDTSKIENTLFPTLVDEETNNPYNYFGSLSISGRTLYFFECPEEYAKIEIYEDVLESNCSDGFIDYDYLTLKGEENIISPAIMIYLGPLRDVFNNPTEFYYVDDPLRDRAKRTNISYSTLEYSRLCDEITGKKVVCFFRSTNDNVMDFNLAFSAFEHNSNPLRNKWKYDLRNDELSSVVKNFEIIERTDGGIVKDTKIGTILGNLEIPNNLCPIKEKKLERLRRTQGQFYSPYRRYNKGDDTIYKIFNSDGTATIYNLESLIDGNIGNDPLLSPAWILKDKFLDFLTNIIYISLNPAESNGTINPGTQITVKSDSSVDFSISEGVGYLFNGVSIINKSNEVIDLEENVDYTYTIENTPEEYIKKVNISSWSDLIIPDSDKYTSNLVFNFTNSPSVIKILAKKSGIIYHYSDWESKLPELELEFSLNGEPVTPPNGMTIIYNNGDMYLYITNPQLNPVLGVNIGGTYIKKKINSNYRIGSSKHKKVIEIDDNGFASDTIDFSEAEWVINLQSNTRKLSIRCDSMVLCDNTGFIDVDYGSTYSIQFSQFLWKPENNVFPFSVDVVNFYYDENNRIVKNDNPIDIESCPFNGSLILDGVETSTISITEINSGRYELQLGNILENTIIQILRKQTT